MRWILWVIGIPLLLLDIPAIFSIIEGSTPQEADFVIIITAITLILAFSGWVSGYNIRDGFEGRLAKVNDPDLIQRWLTEWRAESSFHRCSVATWIDNIYDDRDISMRRASYSHLERFQHLCDPIKPDWINIPVMFKVGK